MSAEPNATAPVTADPALPPTDPSTGTSHASSLPSNPAMPGSEKDGSAAPSKRQIHLPSIPTDLKSLTTTTDSTLTRLNTLLKTPGGLACFLSTTNYGLYILAHLHSTAPTRAQLLLKLSNLLGRTPPKPRRPNNPPPPPRPHPRRPPHHPPPHRPNPPSRKTQTDSIAYTIKLAQATSYTTFQLLENIYHLTNKSILQSTWTNTRFSRLGGHAKLMTWSCRAWLAGISCDFLRLAREAQVSRRDGKYEAMNEEEKRSVDKKFWSELFVACAWYPMALHYSVEGGIGLNLGMVGACGFLANLGNFLKAWEATTA